MSKQELKLARELIEGKRYGEARIVLEKSSDPLATVWLAKLDKIAPEEPTVEPAKPRNNSTLISLFTMIVIFIIGGIIGFVVGRSSSSGTPSPVIAALTGCSPSDWWKQAEPTVIEFLDTAETATQTSRGSLSPIILSMRNTQREFERLDVPDCVDDIQLNVSRGMENAVSGFNDFLGQSDTLSNIEFTLASQYFWNAYKLMFSENVFTDVRMSNTAVFIWGGDEPTEAEATKMASPS